MSNPSTIPYMHIKRTTPSIASTLKVKSKKVQYKSDFEIAEILVNKFSELKISNRNSEEKNEEIVEKFYNEFCIKGAKYFLSLQDIISSPQKCQHFIGLLQHKKYNLDKIFNGLKAISKFLNQEKPNLTAFEKSTSCLDILEFNKITYDQCLMEIRGFHSCFLQLVSLARAKKEITNLQDQSYLKDLDSTNPKELEKARKEALKLKDENSRRLKEGSKQSSHNNGFWKKTKHFFRYRGDADKKCFIKILECYTAFIEANTFYNEFHSKKTCLISRKPLCSAVELLGCAFDITSIAVISSELFTVGVRTDESSVVAEFILNPENQEKLCSVFNFIQHLKNLCKTEDNFTTNELLGSQGKKYSYGMSEHFAQLRVGFTNVLDGHQDLIRELRIVIVNNETGFAKSTETYDEQYLATALNKNLELCRGYSSRSSEHKYMTTQDAMLSASGLFFVSAYNYFTDTGPYCSSINQSNTEAKEELILAENIGAFGFAGIFYGLWQSFANRPSVETSMLYIHKAKIARYHFSQLANEHKTLEDELEVKEVVNEAKRQQKWFVSIRKFFAKVAQKFVLWRHRITSNQKLQNNIPSGYISVSQDPVTESAKKFVALFFMERKLKVLLDEVHNSPNNMKELITKLTEIKKDFDSNVLNSQEFSFNDFLSTLVFKHNSVNGTFLCHILALQNEGTTLKAEDLAYLYEDDPLSKIAGHTADVQKHLGDLSAFNADEEVIKYVSESLNNINWFNIIESSMAVHRIIVRCLKSEKISNSTKKWVYSFISHQCSMKEYGALKEMAKRRGHFGAAALASIPLYEFGIGSKRTAAALGNYSTHNGTGIGDLVHDAGFAANTGAAIGLMTVGAAGWMITSLIPMVFDKMQYLETNTIKSVKNCFNTLLKIDNTQETDQNNRYSDALTTLVNKINKPKKDGTIEQTEFDADEQKKLKDLTPYEITFLLQNSHNYSKINENISKGVHEPLVVLLQKALTKDSFLKLIQYAYNLENDTDTDTDTDTDLNSICTNIDEYLASTGLESIAQNDNNQQAVKNDPFFDFITGKGKDGKDKNEIPKTSYADRIRLVRGVAFLSALESHLNASKSDLEKNSPEYADIAKEVDKIEARLNYIQQRKRDLARFTLFADTKSSPLRGLAERDRTKSLKYQAGARAAFAGTWGAVQALFSFGLVGTGALLTLGTGVVLGAALILMAVCGARLMGYSLLGGYFTHSKRTDSYKDSVTFINNLWGPEVFQALNETKTANNSYKQLDNKIINELRKKNNKKILIDSFMKKWKEDHQTRPEGKIPAPYLPDDFSLSLAKTQILTAKLERQNNLDCNWLLKHFIPQMADKQTCWVGLMECLKFINDSKLSYGTKLYFYVSIFNQIEDSIHEYGNKANPFRALTVEEDHGRSKNFGFLAFVFGTLAFFGYDKVGATKESHLGSQPAADAVQSTSAATGDVLASYGGLDRGKHAHGYTTHTSVSLHMLKSLIHQELNLLDESLSKLSPGNFEKGSELAEKSPTEDLLSQARKCLDFKLTYTVLKRPSLWGMLPGSVKKFPCPVSLLTLPDELKPDSYKIDEIQSVIYTKLGVNQHINNSDQFSKKLKKLKKMLKKRKSDRAKRDIPIYEEVKPERSNNKKRLPLFIFQPIGTTQLITPAPTQPQATPFPYPSFAQATQSNL